MGDGSVAVTLQNGLGNLEVIAEELGPQRVLLGMTYVGATVTGPGRARFTAAGQTFIGEPNGDLSERAQSLAKMLTCALTGASGEAALASPAASELVGLVAEETAAVARALGVDLPYADPAARVRQHCRDVGAS